MQSDSAQGAVQRVLLSTGTTSGQVPLSIGFAPNDTAAWLVSEAVGRVLSVSVSQDARVEPSPLPLVSSGGATPTTRVNATRVIGAVAAASPMVRMDIADARIWGHASVLECDALATEVEAAVGAGVMVLGASGAAQQPGLYVPRYTASAHPGLSSWQGLATDAGAAAVGGTCDSTATAPETPLAPCVGSCPCGEMTRVLCRLDTCAPAPACTCVCAGILYAGPPSPAGLAACGENGTLAALNVSVACEWSASWGQQLARLAALESAQQPYLALLLAPSRAQLALNASRVALPERTLACLSLPSQPCEFAAVRPQKVRACVWCRCPAVWCQRVTRGARLNPLLAGTDCVERCARVLPASSVGSRSRVHGGPSGSHRHVRVSGGQRWWAGRGSPRCLGHCRRSRVGGTTRGPDSWVGACAAGGGGSSYTGPNGGRAGHHHHRLRVRGAAATDGCREHRRDSMYQHQVAGRHQLGVYYTAWCAHRLRAWGCVPASRTRQLTCPPPASLAHSHPGVGIDLPVGVSLGLQRAASVATYSYAPALLRGVFTPAALLALETGDALAPLEARRVNVGQQLTVVGDNFAPSTTMQCRFNGVAVQATYVNSTTALCSATQDVDGEGPAVPCRCLLRRGTAARGRGA